MLSPKTRAPTRPGTAKRRNAKPNAVNRLGNCYSRASTGAALRLGRGSNGGLCLRRLGLELAAGGVKRPFEHWRAVAAPDVKLPPARRSGSVAGNGGLCLRRLGLELAAGGVKRPFAHWRAVAAPDVEPENSGSNSSRHRKTTKRKTQCCQSLRHLLLKSLVRTILSPRSLMARVSRDLVQENGTSNMVPPRSRRR